MGQPLDAAVQAPRMHLEAGTLSLEPGLAQDTVAAIGEAFPGMTQWEQPSLFFGGVHAVQRDAQDELTGAADSRRGGVVRRCPAEAPTPLD